MYVLLLGRLLLEGLEAGLFSVSYDACSCGLRKILVIDHAEKIPVGN